jgi:hypothetical protein
VAKISRPISVPIADVPYTRRMGGDAPFARTDAILGAGGLDYALYDSAARDRMWNLSRGEGVVGVDGNNVGLIVGREKQGRKTFAEVMAAQPERMPDGDFASGTTTGWTGNGSAVSLSVVDGWFRVTNISGTSNAVRAIYNVGAAFAGKFVAIGITSRGIPSSASVRAVSAPSGSTTVLATITPNQRSVVQVFVPADRPWIELRAENVGDGSFVEWGGISIKEVPAHYASQNVSNSRPVLQADGLKFDGGDDLLVSDWMASAGANCILALVNVPVDISSLRVIAGLSGAASGRFYVGIDGSGRVCGGLGDEANTIVVGTGDVRGGIAFISLSTTGTDYMLVGNDTVRKTGTQAGALNTAVAAALGALNNNGTPSVFWPGTIKRAAFGRVAPTFDQIQQIRAEWLAAA